MNEKDFDFRNYTGTYQTGRTQPPKHYRGVLAFLIGLVILLSGISTALSIMNLKLYWKLNTVEKAPQVSFSRAEEIPQPTGTEEMEFDPLPDVSELLEKMGQIDKQAQSFLSDAEILVSADGKQVRIFTDNAFAVMMLSKDSSRNAIARAMALCRITTGQATITVRETQKKSAVNTVESELY